MFDERLCRGGGVGIGRFLRQTDNLLDWIVVVLRQSSRWFSTPSTPSEQFNKQKKQILFRTVLDATIDFSTFFSLPIFFSFPVFSIFFMFFPTIVDPHLVIFMADGIGSL